MMTTVLSAARAAFPPLALAATLSVAAPPASAGDPPRGRYCSATTQSLFEACDQQRGSVAANSRALCINLADPAQRRACQGAARQADAEARQLCAAQRDARAEVCAGLGEARYEPGWNPADFDPDFHHPAQPNPWFPLVIGNRWKYGGGGEAISVEVLAKTKLIDGVTCVVVSDQVTDPATGKLVEDTLDWYAQRRNGNVDYCGESSRSYAVFAGDQPAEPELVDLHGSWKRGRGGALAGTQFLGAPVVGALYRQEFSPNVAEDVARIVSTSYTWGRDPVLDRYVPKALAQLLCAANNCVVTEEFTPLEPGQTMLKYYAAGIGLFLEVDPASGEANQLLECNVAPSCSALPALARR